jgi:hypothetical protein
MHPDSRRGRLRYGVSLPSRSAGILPAIRFALCADKLRTIFELPSPTLLCYDTRRKDDKHKICLP